MAAPVVGIVGAKALRKDLNRLTSDVNGPLYKAMRQAGLESVQPVVGLTLTVLPQRTGRLAKTVRASGTRSGGAVRMGTRSVSYAGPVEFGGWPHGRPFIASGRYLFPAARGDAERAANAYSDNLARVFASSGIWTNTSTNGSAVHD